MTNLPWWASILVTFALKFGLPALEKIVPAQIASIIDAIIAYITASQNPIKAAADMHAHVKTLCDGVGCPTQPVVE